MQVLVSLIGKHKNRIMRILTMGASMLVLLLLLSQVVFARNTYVITDGDHVKVHTTFASDPETVLSEAGFLLEPDDTFTTQALSGISEITVRRSQFITVNYCGTPYVLHSYGETLETLLDRLGIPSHGNYEASLPLNTQTYDGMEVTVNCIVRTEEFYTVDIPYETSYCYDSTLPAGTQEILIPGVVGQILCKSSVVYVDAQETERLTLEQTVIQQPVDQVIAIGTMEEPAVSEAPAVPVIGDGIIITTDGQLLTYDMVLHVKSTAYTKTDAGCNDTTATGTKVRVGTVAVDPKVIPYGTRMFIVSDDGEYIYGIGTAEDCGGAIKGDRIDLYFDTTEECFQFGIRNCTVYILGGGA